MEINSAHCLTSAVMRYSEHCDEPNIDSKQSLGLQGTFQSELIVLHCVSLPAGSFGNGAPSRLFTGELDCTEHPEFSSLQGVRVSPHLLIDRLGNIEQFVPFDRGAWHAGSSTWKQRPSCNKFSVGIELEGTWDSAFTKSQYAALTDVCLALCNRYPRLSPDNIVGHQEVSPGRKEDPGPHFDWAKLLIPLHRQLYGNRVSTVSEA